MKQRFNAGMVMGLGLGLLGYIPGAIAADTVTLVYREDRVVIPTAALTNFAQTGTALTPEGQAFVEKHPELSQILRDVMRAEIAVNPVLEQGEPRSAIAEFLLLRLNNVFTNASVGSDLEPIRTALRTAYRDDNRFSLLEVLNSYPRPDIQVDLNQLEPVYNDVKAFVERIQPALAAAREFLQEFVCDCETAPATASTVSPEGPSPTPTTPPSATPKRNGAIAPSPCSPTR